MLDTARGLYRLTEGRAVAIDRARRSELVTDRYAAALAGRWVAEDRRRKGAARD